MTLDSKSFDTPDEQRTPDKTQVDVVRIGGASVARLTLQPGWRWSECVRPVVGGDSCQVRHVGALLAGQMEVVHDDGSQAPGGHGRGLRDRPRSRRLGGG